MTMPEVTDGDMIKHIKNVLGLDESASYNQITLELRRLKETTGKEEQAGTNKELFEQTTAHYPTLSEHSLDILDTVNGLVRAKEECIDTTTNEDFYRVLTQYNRFFDYLEVIGRELNKHGFRIGGPVFGGVS